MKKTDSVAVIGAGLAGLSCAQMLKAQGVDVRVYERNGAVGGRCATQLWQGHLVDSGVQYFTAQSGEFKKELLTRLRQFRPIISPIVDQRKNVVPNAYGPRFYVLQGNNYFAHVLSQGLEVQLNCPVDSLDFRSGGIRCQGEIFRAVVAATPGPLAAPLLALKESIGEYEACLVALLEYAGGEVGTSRSAYARLVVDEDGPIQSSYCENNKVGRIVGNKTVFVVEASPAYSREFGDAPADLYLAALVKRHEQMWEIPAGKLSAAYGHSWKYARPRPGTRPPVDLPFGTFLAGDSRVEATVESVWLDGQKAAGEVMAFLKKTA